MTAFAKPHVLILLFLCFTFLCKGQPYQHKIICPGDTISVQYEQTIFSLKKITPYRFVKCSTRSAVSLRADVAAALYHYGPSTKAWLGDHGGPSVGVAVGIGKVNLGARAKPYTINPGSELVFNGSVLGKNRRLNPNKADFFIGYTIDLPYSFSFEPNIGYTRVFFYVLDDDDGLPSPDYKIPSSGGLLAGFTFNRYFTLKPYAYFSVFASLNYGFVNYEKVHPSLTNNYLEWNIGIAYKGYFTKSFRKKIE